MLYLKITLTNNINLQSKERVSIESQTDRTPLRLKSNLVDTEKKSYLREQNVSKQSAANKSSLDSR